MVERVAVLLDGEFVKKVLQRRLGRFPDEADIMAEVERILASPHLADHRLYRTFYYTADPLKNKTSCRKSGRRAWTCESDSTSPPLPLRDWCQRSPW